MAEEAKNKASAPKFRTSIGGQALIEGVLMRGPGKQAIVVRSPDGLVEKVEELTLVRDKYPVLGLPIIRGAVTFVDSMVKGVKALMFSADYFPDEDVAEPSKFDQWLEKKLGNEKMQKFITALAVFLSLGLTILLFFLLPTFLAGFIDPYIKSAAVHNLVESVIKLVIFFAYMILCSKQKDIYRVFQYHGAEHKTIFCYEAGLPLTVENCRIQPRHHPRCGTSFLFVVVVVSILVSSLVFSFVNWRNMWVRMALHLLLLIPIVGVTYEFNRYVGGHDNKVTRFLARPGLWVANFTPQPLNVKSSREGVPLSIMVIAPWSRAHVSLVSHSKKRTLSIFTLEAICSLTASGSGVTIRSNSRSAISRAMFIKHSCTSVSIYAQSVPACGHVNFMPLCVCHSAGR